MNYTCYTEYTEPEQLNISELFYEIKEFRLIEISLENGLAIRQWKDIPMMYEAEDKEVFHMEYGMLYCTHGQDIINVWHGWGEEELEEYIKACEGFNS